MSWDALHWSSPVSLLRQYFTKHRKLRAGIRVISHSPMKLLTLLPLFLSALAQAANDTPPELPLPVASFGAAAMPDGTLYVYGGHSGRRHKYNRDDVHGGLFRWRSGMDHWEALPQDEPAQGASLVAVKDGVIRIGGMAARNAAGEKQDLWSSETAARFDIASGKWLPLPKLPQRRSSHDSILCNGTLYVIGGWSMEGEAGTTWHDNYLTLDLQRADATWQSHPQPFKRRALAVQAFGDKVYALGGMDDDNHTTCAVSVLDTRTGTWSEGPALPTDKIGGFGFAAVVQDGRLFASGVRGELLELRGSTWAPVAKLAHPRYFHRLLNGGAGRLIAIGGETGAGAKTPPEVITLPAAAGATVQSDWPRFQGPRGNGTTPEVGWNTRWPADGPPVLWQAELGQGLASFAIVGSHVFTAGNNGADQDTVWCLDLESGTPVWTHKLAVPTKAHEMSIVPYGPAATPTVVDGRVYYLSREGHLLCLDATTGKTVWQKHYLDDFGGKRPVYGYASSPAVHQGRLYLDVGGSTGSNVCLNAATGETVWQTGEGEAGYATPWITQQDKQDVLVLFKGEALELRNAADGSLIARHAAKTTDFCNCATPVRSGDLFFISHTGGMGSCALAWKDHTLTQRWTQRDIGLLFQSGLPWEGGLLVFNDQKRGVNDLRLLDLATGETRWQTAEIDKGTGILADDGHALFLTGKGEIVLARVLADKPDILSRAQVLGGKTYIQPALAHGRLLCRNNSGTAVCLNLR